MAEPAIETRALTRRFGDFVAVDSVTLSIPRARIFGFLGPNGSGKTTTIRMLCGLLEPSAGGAEVLGLEVPRDAEELRLRIGYMTQRFSLYEDLTVHENLEFLSEIYALPKSERGEAIGRKVDQYDLLDLAAQRAGTLSGGQRQRLALAGATLHGPELLFLDEPTSAVDPESRRDFWEALFELADAGTTILVSTHYMDEAERCHGLAILDRGRLVATGAPRDLIRDIAAAVVEIETERPRAIHPALADRPEVMSLTQLGTRLHVLLDPALPEPAAWVHRKLEAAGLEARVSVVPASLEEVFVVATSARVSGRAGDAGGSP